MLALALLIGCAGIANPVAADSDLPAVDAAPLGPSARERMDEIRRRVQTALIYPPIARQRSVSGEAQVSFRILEDGRPDEVETVVSSGSPVLDRAAMRAVSDAAPLPHMLGRVVVPVRFVLREPDALGRR